MGHFNLEIKARCANPERVRAVLQEMNSRFVGTDRQVDTYFNVPEGRLKLREGNIERALIHYLREDQTGPRRSDVLLYQPGSGDALKQILERSLGVLVVVRKQRDIHFIDNVKIHIDEVEELGSFVEIEAIASKTYKTPRALLVECRLFMACLGVGDEDLVEGSYSDLVLAQHLEAVPLEA